MDTMHAKVIVNGSPISKSNFKLFNLNGRAILPFNSGAYHDRYANYEEKIAYEARLQNPKTILKESLIAVLKVFYKSSKRHPDTNNITKSIFDGIEKSGLIINDAQIRRLIIEEFYDKDNPRFELELYCESKYYINYSIETMDTLSEPILYSEPCNRKNPYANLNNKEISKDKEAVYCCICGKKVKKNEAIYANNKKLVLCKNCLGKSF